MSFCINRWCHSRQNPDNINFCQYCGTELVVNNRYRLIGSLIEDKRIYSEVFEVEDLMDNRTRKVLKILVDTSNDAIAQLFEQEKEILHALKHSGIPKYKDYFEFAVSNPQRRELRCLVMDKIDGENLDDWLKKNGKISDESEALDWLKKLTTILFYVHEKNFFHRDIKPSNIIRNLDGNLVLIDFGTARQYTATVINGQRVTQVYSHGYTPPEQKNFQAVPQSDFYALGRTFVHLLTGRHPDDLDLDHWHTETEFPTSLLIDLINRLLEPNPENRPQTAKEILNEIRTIQDQQSQSVRVSQPPPKVSISKQKNRGQKGYPPKLGVVTLFALGVALGVAAAGFIIIPLIWCKIPFSACPGSNTAIQDPKDVISSGEKAIAQRTKDLAEPYATLMQTGMIAYSEQRYNDAFNAFDALRNKAQQETNVNRDNPTGTNAYQEARDALANPEIEIARNNAAAWQRHEQDGSPIYTIAVAAPVNQPDGTHILFGVAQVQDKAVNEQKINLVVVVSDDRNIRDQAKENANELVKRDILAVVGHYTSPNTCAALPIYDQNQLAIISPTSTIVDLRSKCDGNTNKVFFRTASTTKVEAQTLVNYLVNSTKGGKTKPRVAVFYNADEDFSKDIFEQFKQALKNKGTIIKYFDFSEKNQNFSAIQSVEQVKKDADALVVLPDGQTETPAPFRRAIEVIKANKGEKLVLGSNPLYLEDVLSRVSGTVGNKALDKKLFIAVDWHPQQCGAKAFVDKADDKWLGGVNRRTALSYEAVQVLLKTFKPNVNKLDVLRALSSGIKADSDVIKGKTISFDRNGDRNESKAFIVTVELDGNKPKFVPLAGDRCPKLKQVQQS